MTSLAFKVTWDYRCPFARNVHEHLLTGLAAGADWDVEFLPFSLGQVHVEDGAVSVWEQPEQDSGILALQAGVYVRDHHPQQWAGVHRALFAVRHDEGLQLSDRAIIEKTLLDNGVPAADVLAAIDSGDVLAAVKEQHEQYAHSHTVWGVPTFIVGDQAVFVRLMNRAPVGSDPAESIRAIERVVDLAGGWPDLNEFKHTSIPR